MQAMWLPMDLSASMVLIVVVGVFLASFMDGVAGGGGIISVPTYFLAGLPSHLALGTNKLSSCIGTAVSAGRFVKGGYVNWKLGLPSIALALFGAALGTRLQLMVDERVLQILLLAVLPVVAFVVLRQRSLPETPGEIAPGKQAAVVLSASLVVGAYDGFYGPGTGTFLILIFCTLGKLDVRTASGNVKLVNLSSNIGALCTSLLHGKVFLALGLIGAVASVAGHWLGSGLAIKDGSKIVKPTILVVLVLLTVKVVSELL
ncbi:MAG: TSUP family transporter [Oscillospiraceae bacterium]|nr:TSUP family transporter [Oscillospiraceae bacterium]